MKRTLPLLLIVLSLFFATSCSKDDTSASTSNDYSPTTTGSSWTYKITEGSTVVDTIKLTATTNTKVINEVTYRICTTEDGDTTLLGKKGNDYYRYQGFSGLGVENFEELYLKDNLAVNGTWSTTTTINNPGIPFPITTAITYVIKEKDVNTTVNGKTYNNVIHVRMDINVLTIPAGGGDFYYAKGIGWIKSEIAINIPTMGITYNGMQELIASDIK